MSNSVRGSLSLPGQTEAEAEPDLIDSTISVATSTQITAEGGIGERSKLQYHLDPSPFPSTHITPVQKEGETELVTRVHTRPNSSQSIQRTPKSELVDHKQRVSRTTSLSKMSTTQPEGAVPGVVASPTLTSTSPTNGHSIGKVEDETETILGGPDGIDEKQTRTYHHIDVSDEDPEVQKRMALPECFIGAKDLKVPHLIKGTISSVTLPSRLKLLGRKGYKLLAALRPINCGNAVVGFAPVCSGTKWTTKRELFLLPYILSKANARMHMFVRILFLILSALFIVSISGAAEVHVGRVWPIGTCLALLVMYLLTLYRRAPDGTMAFCRSMGTPEVEEYMFSYSWKVQPDNIRTLAKALWEGGVGVWIDVVKLCPGDEIRPMVRTMVNRVYRVVVFLSPAYISSPNCCVEFMEAAQHPEKLVVCILKDCDPAVYDYLDTLKAKGAKICFGMKEAIKVLDDETTAQDSNAFKWWRRQKVSGAGVPTHVVPDNWKIPTFSLRGRPVLPPKSVDVGPMYLAGSCTSHGRSVKLPWLFLIAFAGAAVNFIDLYLKFKDDHTTIDYVWLISIACCNLAPFWNLSNLFDTRRDLHYAIRPLMASRAIAPGVKVAIVGSSTDPYVIAMRGFLSSIGHLAEEYSRLTIRDSIRHTVAQRQASMNNGNGTSNGGPTDQVINVKDGTGQTDGFGDQPRIITVYVMDSLESRDQLFGNKMEFDNQSSLFVWTGQGDPFTKDPVGERLMRFLVLVAAWEKSNLAESLFSAIGVRVVDILHRGK